eukprot:GHRR01032222.1.p1 GENE.GHRR01032222.1~~GHRR01032222.1.p1  ORF type:complete len:108 (+),score=36.75 GHRR01032222.1:152-475(+)
MPGSAVNGDHSATATHSDNQQLPQRRPAVAAVAAIAGSSSGDHSREVSEDVEAGNNPQQVAKDAEHEEEQEEQYVNVTYADIAKQFSLLGWTAFGGPAAHIGLFQRV